MALIPAIKRGSVSSVAINAALEDAVTLEVYTVATLPAAASTLQKLVYVSNGAAGQPCVAISNGTAWKIVANLTTATTVAAS